MYATNAGGSLVNTAQGRAYARPVPDLEGTDWLR